MVVGTDDESDKSYPCSANFFVGFPLLSSPQLKARKRDLFQLTTFTHFILRSASSEAFNLFHLSIFGDKTVSKCVCFFLLVFSSFYGLDRLSCCDLVLPQTDIERIPWLWVSPFESMWLNKTRKIHEDEKVSLGGKWSAKTMCLISSSPRWCVPYYELLKNT